MKHAAEANTTRVLVFGATGYIGSHLVPALCESGYVVRASSRDRDTLAARQWQGVELVEADALQLETLKQALTGIDVAYYLVHSMAAGSQFAEIDRRAAKNFAIAAQACGVTQIVYLGGIVPRDARSEHILSRKQTGDTLRSAGSVAVTEIRAGIIVGPGSAAFEVMRDLVFHLPVMVTPRWVHSKSQPIALENLLHYLVKLAKEPAAFGRIYDAAGPQSLTYHQMMVELASVAGKRKPLIFPVPVLTPELSSYWLKAITSVPTSIARALIEGLKHDFYADNRELVKLVPQQLLNFRESVARAFSLEKQHAVQTRWVEGAFPLRERRIDYAFYAKKAGGSALAKASPKNVWSVLTKIGGDNGYFYLNGLWVMREGLDWLVGGSGLNCKRRHPEELRLGDKVDSWTVIGIEPCERLTLQFGMRAPGAGVLEFNIKPISDEICEIKATAYWNPAGVAGLTYWYSLAAIHSVIFKGMTKEIAQRAEHLQELEPQRSPEA